MNDEAVGPGAGRPGPARPGRAGRRSRALRRGIIAALVLIVFLVVLDRIAEIVTARTLAGKVQKRQGLSARPHVNIHGFPFLTQVIRGRYARIDLGTASAINRDGVRVASAQVRLDGVKVNALDALRGSVRDVPVEHGTGQALVTYPDLSALLSRYTAAFGATITVTAAGPGRARLVGPFGLSMEVRAAIVGGGVRITPDPAQLQTLPALLRTTLDQALSTPIALPPFPFGVTLTSGDLEPAGLVLHAVSRNSVFPTR